MRTCSRAKRACEVLYGAARAALIGQAAPADVLTTVQNAICDMETVPMEPHTLIAARERQLREELES